MQEAGQSDPDLCKTAWAVLEVRGLQEDRARQAARGQESVVKGIWMQRLEKFLIAAIAFAAVQTINAAAFCQNAVGWGVSAFCWSVVIVIALCWKRAF